MRLHGRILETSLRASVCALLVGCGGTISTASGTTSNEAGTPPPSKTDAGPADADSHPCIDTESDGHNCGVCGRDCQGGACVAGVCQPVVLARGEDAPLSLALDGTHVYWANWTDIDLDPDPNTTTIRSIAKSGGPVATLGSTSPFLPTSLRVDGDSLYFYRSMIDGTPVDGAGVMHLCTDGSCPVTRIFGPGEDNGVPITLDATHVYFHDDRLQGLIRIDKDGTNPQLVASDYSIGGGGVASPFYDVAVDATGVYAISDVELARFTGNPSNPLTLATGSLTDLAVDDRYAFVAASTRLLRVSKDGSDLVTLATGAATSSNAYSGPIQKLALDTDRVYWLETSPPGPFPALRAVNKDGSGSISLRLDVQPAWEVLGVDDTCVYWAAVEVAGPPWRGSIMKVVKPL